MAILNAVCARLVISESELVKFARSAPVRYKKYRIPKRSGNEFRLIAQPARSVKFLQAVVVDELRAVLPVHSCAMAYEKGRGIKENASVHRVNQYLLKMDFKDFFPSITPDFLFGVAERRGVFFSVEEKEFLSGVLFWKLRRNSPLRLSIGAPSSPFISNAVMFDFDVLMFGECKKRNISYTRYADDITFSSNVSGALSDVPALVVRSLRQGCFGCIRVNSNKTVFSSKAFNRHVTGVTLANDGRITVGRERKREVMAMVHHFSLGLLDKKQTGYLRGIISHITHIEPGFKEKIERRYGGAVLGEIYSVG